MTPRERSPKQPLRRERSTSERRGNDAASERVFGLAAARAVLSVRPRDVLQIAHAREARRELSELLSAAAKLRIAYREVPREELERIAGSLHHEGICMQVVARRRVALDDLERALAKGGFVLALDRVDNPHNIGALLRTAAFFGARGLLVAQEREARLTPSAVRIAEGAAEHVPVCFVPELGDALDRLVKAGASVIGADAHEGEPVAQLRWPERTVLVLGSERVGIGAPVQKRCSAFVHIAGTEAVESLNVSVAAGILMAAVSEAARRRR
jgi:TrmH RNA methyltransferase